MIEILDSYYEWVRGQMALVNSAQYNLFGGVIEARDWPQTKPMEGALYLLVISTTPQPGGTEGQNLYECLCQWSWLFIGTDIQATQRGQNRGDRYRSNRRVMDDLRQANFPSFCLKKQYSVNQSTGELIAVQMTSTVPYSPTDSIKWSQLTFTSRSDEKSGLVYGFASVRVYGYDDVLASLPEVIAY